MKKKLAIQDSHWRIVEDFIPVLQALKCATTALGTDLMVSCSVVYPVVNGLLTIHLSECDDDSQVVSEFKRAVSASLRRRIMNNAVVINDNQIDIKLPAIAAMLDPQHKQLKFLPRSQLPVLKQQLCDLLQGLSSRLAQYEPTD